MHETTDRVLAARRLFTLRELASAASKAKSAEDAGRNAVQVLARNSADVPFAMCYLVHGSGASAALIAVSGVPEGGAVAPASLDLATRGGPDPWLLREASGLQAPVVVGDLRARFGEAIHAGPYPEAVGSAVVLPLVRPGAERPYGFVVAGVNPRRALDDRYHEFFELACDHVASAVSNALSYEHEKRRAEELAALDRQKTLFFGNVSHEFRTPLALMLGPLADALDSPERALTGKSLVAAHRNALRLLKLVNALLEFSRIEAGRVRAVVQATDLAALTRELATAFESLAERANVALIVDCEPLGEPAYVDREMWEKIVLNLLSNAFKFTFEGSIHVSLVRAGECAELTVRDTGVGIPKEEIPRLFERFHRVEGTRARTHERSGIGLALVYELVHLHKGSVRVESELGLFTRFVVRIPLGTPHGAEAPEGQVQQASTPVGVAPFVAEASQWIDGEVVADVLTAEPDSVSPGIRGARVLVVDDNSDMRDYVTAVLQRHFELDSASDGVEALARIELAPPDLVLADVMMPNLDGLGLVRAIRSGDRTRALPVILLSARVGEESRVEGLEAGADDYMTKPFSARELVARVRTHLELGRLRARIETSRRAAAEAERGRIYGLFMQAPAAICVLRGPEHVYELANPLYIELVGGRDVVGKPLAEALPEAAPAVMPILDRVYRTGEPFFGSEFPVPLVRSGRLEQTYFNFVYKPVVDEQGRIEGIAVVASEVTEQVKSRQVAERLSQELAISNNELDQFAHVASHDLKAPLRGISSLSQWIEEALDDKLDEETRKHMDLLRGRVRRLEALIEGILSYSRAGRTRERTESIDVAALLAETRDLLAPGPDAAVTIHLPMPTLRERVPLQQVFLNLMSNALKHAGRSDARVDVACEVEGAFFHFRVADNGPGIAPEYHERIWAIFTTLNPRDRVESTGIGLSVVKKVVETRGGRVSVESEVGKGATFHVHWPRGAG